MRRIFILAVVSGCAAPTRALPPEDAAVPVDLALVEDDLAVGNDLARNDFARPIDLAQADSMPDAAPSPLPQSWSSPGLAPTAIWANKYAADYRVTLAADEPGARIYYTVDGTAPSFSSPNAITPVPSFALNAASTRIRWFASGAGGPEAAHDETHGVDTTLQSSAGYITQDTSFDGNGPVVVVAPSAVVMMTTTIRVWYQSSGCSGGTFPCAAQLVYGVDKIDQGCLHAGNTYNFAGSSLAQKTVPVTAPATPGVHEVQVAHIEELTCDNAKAMMALKIRFNMTRVGVLIVR